MCSRCGGLGSVDNGWCGDYVVCPDCEGKGAIDITDLLHAYRKNPNIKLADYIASKSNEDC